MTSCRKDGMLAVVRRRSKTSVWQGSVTIRHGQTKKAGWLDMDHRLRHPKPETRINYCFSPCVGVDSIMETDSMVSRKRLFFV